MPAVKTLYLVGVNDAVKLAKSLGISGLNDPARVGLSLVLGGGEVKLLEHVSAYGTLATGGKPLFFALKAPKASCSKNSKALPVNE